jgi:glycosyltransferase involved in cell wall biosynthesis
MLGQSVKTQKSKPGSAGLKRPVRIAINASMLDEQPTGVGVFTYNLINHLYLLYQKENSFPITVYSPAVNLLNDEVEVVKIPSLLQASRYGKFAALLRFLWNTFSYPFWASLYDVVICPTTHGSFTYSNQVLTIHDLLSLRYKNISAHQRFYYKFLLKQMIRRAKVIVTVSETTKREVMMHFDCPEEKIKVVYNGYNAEQYYSSTIRTEVIYKKYSVRNYFLAVGPTYAHKNFEFLIRTYKKLDKTTRKSFPLVIAGGRKEYIQQLQKVIHQEGITEDVHLIGYVPAPLMASLYREAYALIYPSLYEGFGLPLLESMACGCPVLAASVSSIPEVCGKTACYFDPEVEESLKLAMEKIIADQSYRNMLSKAGPKRATLFSWHKTAAAYKKIIEEQFTASHK